MTLQASFNCSVLLTTLLFLLTQQPQPDTVYPGIEGALQSAAAAMCSLTLSTQGQRAHCKVQHTSHPQRIIASCGACRQHRPDSIYTLHILPAKRGGHPAAKNGSVRDAAPPSIRAKLHTPCTALEKGIALVPPLPHPQLRTACISASNGCQRRPPCLLAHTKSARLNILQCIPLPMSCPAAGSAWSADHPQPSPSSCPAAAWLPKAAAASPAALPAACANPAACC